MNAKCQILNEVIKRKDRAAEIAEQKGIKREYDSKNTNISVNTGICIFYPSARKTIAPMLSASPKIVAIDGISL